MKLRGLQPEQERALKEFYEPLQAQGTSPELITSLRYDRELAAATRHVPIALSESYEDRFFLSYLHYQRFKYGASVLGWSIELTYASVCEVLEEAVRTTDGPCKIRVTLDSMGRLCAEASPCAPRHNLFSGLLGWSSSSNEPVWDVVVDDVRCSTTFDESRALKTSERELYNDVRTRHQVSGSREVLLVNSKGLVTEGTITSVAFLRDGVWITPKLADGAMVSVMRSFLLNLGYIKEGDVPASSVAVGDSVILFNGVVGVVKGCIRA